VGLTHSEWKRKFKKKKIQQGFGPCIKNSRKYGLDPHNAKENLK